MNQPFLAIDFGTSSTSGAVVIGNTIQLVSDPYGQGTAFPSSVYQTPEGVLLVGRAADNRRRQDPLRYRRGFKRELGQSTPIYLGDRFFKLEDLVAAVLSKVKAEAETMVNTTLDSVVLTIPAIYARRRKECMQDAAIAAGFKQIEFLPEPVAAAIYCAQSLPHPISVGEIILVYDLGGGTFDAALIQKQASMYKQLALPVGDEFCGGLDFDREIFSDLKTQWADAGGNLFDSSRQELEAVRARMILEDWCQTFKHQLSEDSQFEDVLPIGAYPTYALTRAKFENLIQKYLDRTVTLCRELLKQAQLQPDQVSRVFLVGGSCRIPIIKTYVEKTLGIPVFRADKPELAVCLGSATHKSKKTDSTDIDEIIIHEKQEQELVTPKRNIDPKMQDQKCDWFIDNSSIDTNSRTKDWF